MGGEGSRGRDRMGRGALGGRGRIPAGLTSTGEIARDHWGSAVAAVVRLAGDLSLAEDAAQDACVAALERWTVSGPPADPRSWLIATARHKALDRLRRESHRYSKELQAMREFHESGPPSPVAPIGDDELALIFTCCHPALEQSAQIALTLRSVCGLTTGEIAASFLVPEATMAKRLVRAKQKIRDAGIPFRVPPPDQFGQRLGAVGKVVFLMFTEGHKASTGDELIRAALCDTAIRLARTLHGLLPDEPEVAGLLALLLLTDARRPARIDQQGQLVLLEDQDRSRWNWMMIAEGERLVEQALLAGRTGPYQLHAAIAACHSTAPTVAATDWRQIALLYSELIRYEPTR